jgi:lysophospholipase L1-like esterase
MLLAFVLAALGCEEGTRPIPDEATGAMDPLQMQPDVMDPLQMQPVQMEPMVTAPLGKLTTTDGIIRIMAIGDSITRATCWRANLWDELNQSFPGRFDLVGTLSQNPGCTPAGFDADNQGYSSSLVTEIVANVTTARTCDPSCPTLADLQTAFTATPTDVALIHFGTNDVWNSRPTEQIVAGYTQVVAALRAAHPKIVILVAQIIPMNVTASTCAGCSCAGCVSDIPALNTRILTWAAEQDTRDSPVRVVDQYTGFDATADNRDGVHPNASGAQKMADHWFEALSPLF